MKESRMEFFVTPDGGTIMFAVPGGQVKELSPHDRELLQDILEIIQRQYPAALKALNELYAASKKNVYYYDYLRVSRFIRCNFGKLDGLKFDVDGFVMHVEDVPCPIRCECKLAGVVCNPKPFGLTAKETAIARMASSGMTYKEISQELGISCSNIKNFLQKIKVKLHLKSSKDIAKLIVATL